MMMVTPLARNKRNSCIVLKFGNSAKEHSELSIGRRTAFPSGILHSLITGLS